MPASSAGSINRVGVDGCIRKSFSFYCVGPKAGGSVSLRLGFPFEQAFQDGVGVKALGFSVEIEQNAMAQDWPGQLADVLIGDVYAVTHQSARFSGQHDELGGANAGAEIDIVLNEIGRRSVVGARGADQFYRVARDRVGDRKSVV